MVGSYKLAFSSFCKWPAVISCGQGSCGEIYCSWFVAVSASSFPFVTRAKLHLFEINHSVKIRNIVKGVNKWQNIPKVQNRGEGRGSTIFSPFCILILRLSFGMLRCLVNTFFYLRPKYLLHKNSGIVVLYANINSPRVKHCIFFAELLLKALV